MLAAADAGRLSGHLVTPWPAARWGRGAGRAEPGWTTQARCCALRSPQIRKQALLEPPRPLLKKHKQRPWSHPEARTRDKCTHELPCHPSSCGLMDRRAESDSGCSLPQRSPALCRTCGGGGGGDRVRLNKRSRVDSIPLPFSSPSPLRVHYRIPIGNAGETPDVPFSMH